MDSTISTISAPANSLQVSHEVYASHGTSGISDSTEANISDQAGYRAERKPRWQNIPGIQVTLQGLDQEPQFDEYRRLRSDGRRKDYTRVYPDGTGSGNINQTIEADQLDNRSVNPRTKIILDSFIQQMGGVDQPLSSGSNINTSV